MLRDPSRHSDDLSSNQTARGTYHLNIYTQLQFTFISGLEVSVEWLSPYAEPSVDSFGRSLRELEGSPGKKCVRRPWIISCVPSSSSCCMEMHVLRL